MNHTQNFGLNKPLPDEFYDIEKQNENMDRIDEALKGVKDKAENATESIPEFVQAETRENIKNGETTGRLFGKIARFFADLKPVAFSGSYSDLSNKPNIPTVPDSVKNPHPLSINGHSYDGSAAINAGTIGITYGGTGATTAEAARTNLGLGTASTQGIANNLTTTEAGYALDARQGKVLWDEVGEINSNLVPTGETAVINLADMVQAIYSRIYGNVPQEGSVSKIQDITFNSGGYSKTINMTNITNNWNILNNNNFLVAITSASGATSTASHNTCSPSGTRCGSRLTLTFSKNYVSSTGILTVEIKAIAEHMGDGWNPSNPNYGTINASIYLLQ